MRLIIGENEYSLESILGDAMLGDLRDLKKQSGVTVASIQATFERIGDRAKSGEELGAELLGDDDFLESVIGIVFLARRSRAEHVSFDEAGQISFSDLRFESGDGEGPDPKE